MSDLVKLYHGTGDLEGVIRSKVISSFVYRGRSERFWSYEIKKYDALTKKLAGAAKDHIAAGFLFDSVGDDSSILAHDEVLADLAQLHGAANVNWEDQRDYKELKRTLFVYFMTTLERAKPFSRSRWANKTGALLEVEIPSSLVRQGKSLYSDCSGLREVQKEVSLDYLQQVFVSKDNVRRTVKLLGEYGLKEICIKELD